MLAIAAENVNNIALSPIDEFHGETFRKMAEIIIFYWTLGTQSGSSDLMADFLNVTSDVGRSFFLIGPG